MNYRLLEMPEAAYHADPCDEPSMSRSMANTMLTESPHHAWRKHPKMGGETNEKASKEMNKGTVVHAILGGDNSGIVILKFDSFRTDKAKDTRDRAIAENKTPILEKDFDDCMSAAESIKSQLDGLGYSLEGQREGVAIWDEKADDDSIVKCRSMLDLWDDKYGSIILDFKTTGNGHPDWINRKCIVDFGLDMQAHSQIAGVTAMFPDLAGRVNHVNIFVEMEAPHYYVVPVRQGNMYLAMGAAKWKRCINLFAKCRREKRWPSYTDTTVYLQPEMWRLRKELEFSPELAPLVEQSST